MELAVYVADVLEFNETRRMAYERIVARTTRPEIAQNGVSVLLWMETILGVEMLGKVVEEKMRDNELMWLVLEADAVYSLVLHGHEMPEDLESVLSLETTSNCRLIDSRFFSFHRDLVARGLAALQDGVAALIFDDGLHALMREFREAKGSPPPPELSAPYVIKSRTPPEDSRSAFMAFTRRQTISKEEIIAFFNAKCEGCIESVVTEVAADLEKGEAPPKHGIIVFTDALLRDTVMNQENSASFDINGKGHLGAGVSAAELIDRS